MNSHKICFFLGISLWIFCGQIRSEGIPPLLNYKDLQQVLSHSSGMPHGERGKPFPLFLDPGTRWKYSAEGYYFLQKVVEKLKGDKLENLMQKDILTPLGMTKSCLVWRDDYEKLKIDLDEKGNPVKLIGLYDDGTRDEMARDK